LPSGLRNAFIARRLPQKYILYEVIENLQEIIWSKIGPGERSFIKGFIENLLEDEIAAAFGALRYERSSERKVYLNGHYQRNLFTKYGLVDEIRMPRIDRSGIEFTVFYRYKRLR